MKKSIIILCLLLGFVSSFAKGIRIIENPSVLLSNAYNSLTFTKVILTDTATVIECHSKYRPKFWIRIGKNSFLTANGKKYAVKNGDGITLGKEFWMPESGEADFKLIFEPMPQDTKEFTFKEGDTAGDWVLIGVNISGKKNEVKLPKELTAKKTASYALPKMEMLPGKVTINCHLLSLPKGEKISGTISFSDASGKTTSEFKTDELGNATFQAELMHPTCATMTVLDKNVQFIIVPNETTDVYFNLPVIAEANPKAKQKRFYFTGAMDSFNEEIANSTILDELKQITDFDLILEHIEGLSAQEYITFVHNKCNEVLQKIEKSDLSENAKDGYRANLAFVSISPFIMMSSVMVESKIRSGALSQDSARSYIEHVNSIVKMEERIKYVSEYFAKVKNNNVLFLVSNFDYMLSLLDAYARRGLVWGGADSKFVDDYRNVTNLYKQIKSYTPLADEDLAGVKNEVIHQKLSADNEALKAKIEENRKKTNYRINEAGNVVNEDLFASLTNKYRGKVVLVDFWATWCGPCKMAHKTMRTMKDELKNKMVFLYLAGENSPKATWENIIADIDGEHVRLSNSQWDYLCKEFGADGVPTYLLLDKEGNVAFKSVGYPGNDQMKSHIDKVLNN